MARRVFFTFDYDHDLWRARRVRDTWLATQTEAAEEQPGKEAAGFWDDAAWADVRKKGEDSIKRWIGQHLAGVSVTVLLIGSDTAARSYVQHAVLRSHELGKGIVGVRIHSIKDTRGRTESFGPNPLDSIHLLRGGVKHYFSDIYQHYDWELDDGAANLDAWVEKAAKAAGR